MYQEKEKELTSIEVWINVSIQGFEDYFTKTKEKLIAAAHNGIGNMSTYTKIIKKTMKQKWEEK